MRRETKLPITALILIYFLILGILTLPALAQDLPTLNLNLNPSTEKTCPEDEAAQTNKDPFLEKYNEVMSEIAISDEAVKVVEQIKCAAQDVQDLSTNVRITEIRGQRIEEFFVYLLISVEEKLARIEFLEPSTLRGMIIVADQKNMETRTFQPINNQIMVQGLEDASKEALSALSVAQLTTYFDFTQYKVEVLEVVKLDSVSDYLLEVEALNDEIWHVRVKSDNWIPYEIAVLKGEVMTGKMSLSDVILDPALSVEELMDLPKVKEVRI